ncbi:MAG: cytochrome-c peroxidase [Candidatus Anammoxibacter sp.]
MKICILKTGALRKNMIFTLLNVSILFVFLLSGGYKCFGSELFFEIPKGLDLDLKIPKDNPITKEKVELGKQLYFDKRLSVDNTVSCATCHSLTFGFSDGQSTSTGIKGQKGGRNAPTVINTTYNDLQFWDGRSGSLEEQALGPIQNPIEMGFTLDGVVKRLNQIKGYTDQFQAIFKTDVTSEGIAKAIATFERTILSGGSRWDDYNYGDEGALSDSAKEGLELFNGKALCSSCHLGFNLTDNAFHNIGVGMNQQEPDLGRYNVTKDEKDRGAFKTPTLRDVAKSAPYMHDGGIETLEEVVELYNKGGEPNQWLDKKLKPLNLSGKEKRSIVEFLKNLNGMPVLITPPDLP